MGAFLLHWEISSTFIGSFQHELTENLENIVIV